MKLREILKLAPVIPVITIEELATAVPLAQALVAGGLRVLEITLRTPCALDAIAAMRHAVPEAIIGAGTLLRPADFELAESVGAQFAVTPGLTDELATAAAAASFPLLPGVMTPSEAIAALEKGFDTLKLFPAQQAGGVGMLKALSGPLPELRFCPTGGIARDTAAAFLALPNVLCVGGSWVAPVDAIRAGDWRRIEALARDVMTLASARG